MTKRVSLSFEFVGDITGFRAPDAFVVRLCGRLRRKQDLLRALAEGLKFPPYFGHNWDALEECMCDLSWLGGESGVVVIHKHTPLTDDGQRATYLDILRKAQANQRVPLRVVFPERSRAEVEKARAH